LEGKGSYCVICIVVLENKEIEEYYYKQFAQAYELSADYVVKDRPDIRIIYNDKEVGIEVTCFYLENGCEISSEQKQAPMREKIVQLIQSQYEKERGRGIEITFGFNILPAKGIRRLSKKICDWLIGQSFLESGSLCPSSFEDIPELRFVYVNIGPYGDAKWRVSQVGEVKNTCPNALQNIILEKENLLHNYNKCEEMWLLVVIDFINSGMEQEPLNVDYSNVIKTKFDRVYVFRTGYNTIVEI